MKHLETLAPNIRILNPSIFPVCRYSTEKVMFLIIRIAAESTLDSYEFCGDLNSGQLPSIPNSTLFHFWSETLPLRSI